MEQHLERMQILLERNQRQRLAKLASAQKRSLSNLIREAVDRYLEQDELRRAHAKRAIEQLRTVRNSLLQSRRGQPMEIDVAGLIHQMREERADELDGRVFDH